MLSKIVIFLVVLGLVVGDDLPKYFRKCSKSNSEIGKCIADSANSALEYFAKGIKEYDIPSLNPLEVPLITIDKNGIQAYLTNSTVEGICHSRIIDTNVNFANKTFEFIVKTPKIIFFTNYNVTLGLLRSYGVANITFDDLHLNFNFTYELVNFEENEYIRLKNASMLYAFENISFNIESLSDLGNATKADISEMFASNKLKINNDLGNKIGEAMAQSVAKILSHLFARVPFNKLFDE